MSNVKWIKLTTTMFEDEKIDYIESLPERDAILIIWIKLLTQAGKINSNGFIFLTEQIPYTEETLSHKLKRPITTVRLALKTFEMLGMIEFDDKGYLLISNWEKHQNLERLAELREYNRIAKRKQREREKQQLIEVNDNVNDNNLTSQRCRHLDIEEEIELDIDIDKSIEDKSSPTRSKSDQFDWKSFQEYWNNNSGLANIRQLTQSRKTAVNGRVKEYDLETIYKVIDKCKSSDFLQGKIKSNRKWVATFDWVFSPKNFIKILEGNYDNKETSKPTWYNDYEKDVKEYENKNNKEMTKEEKEKVFEDAKKIFSNLIKGE